MTPFCLGKAAPEHPASLLPSPSTCSRSLARTRQQPGCPDAAEGELAPLPGILPMLSPLQGVGSGGHGLASGSQGCLGKGQSVQHKGADHSIPTAAKHGGEVAE